MASDYSHISFRRSWELAAEVHYQLGQCRGIIHAISGMPVPRPYHLLLLQVSLRKGALATTAIEGNTLTEAEVQRIAEGEPLAPSKAYQEIEVKNILAAMNELLNEVVDERKGAPVSPELILRFHRLVGKDLGQHFDAIPGRWREDARVVGKYRCPNHQQIPRLIDRLCDWLTREFGYESGNQTFEDAVVQAVVTHVYIEWIHPFGDGNGRTGRLLEFYVLLRAGNPDISSHILSNFYNDTRPEYYRQLDRASKAGGNLTDFITYAVQGLRDGLRETLATIQRSVFETSWRSYIYERFAEVKYRKDIFKRRRDLALAMPLGMVLNIEQLAILTPKLARQYAKVVERTLQRDLAALINLELIVKSKKGFTPNAFALKFNLPKGLD